MKIPNYIVLMASGWITAVASAFFREAVDVMIPWLLAMTAVVVTDLASGIRKAAKQGDAVRPSKAFRDTAGKLVVYYAFVLTIAMVDTAAHASTVIAKWCCLFVCAVEGGSIAANILKPHGINLSVATIVKVLFKRSPLSLSDEEAEELIDNKKTNN